MLKPVFAAVLLLAEVAFAQSSTLPGGWSAGFEAHGSVSAAEAQGSVTIGAGSEVEQSVPPEQVRAPAPQEEQEEQPLPPDPEPPLQGSYPPLPDDGPSQSPPPEAQQV